MGADSTGLLIALVVLILLSAFFSASETAFSAVSRIRLKNLAQEGNKKAENVLNVIENYDSMLSTILIGNNIVNIASASIATVLFVRMLGDIGATVSTLVTTVVVLIFAEVTPKSLAKEMPEKFSMNVAGVMKVLMKIFYPLNFLFSAWKKLLKKILRVEHKNNISEGEFLTMVEEAELGGGIDKQDSELIHNVIEFNDLDAGEIITPRVDVIAISKDASKKEIADLFMEHEYSRLPVYDESLDDIVGFIHQKDFFTFVKPGKKSLDEILNPVLHIPPTMKISKALSLLQQNHSHIAVVTDEFGGTDGILTMEDILEELVGEIYDEHDEEIKEFEKIGDNEYKIICNTDLPDMLEFFKINSDSESNSVSGWVVEQLGKIPEVGDDFDYEDLHVVVTKTDSRRVLEITVTVTKAKEEEKSTD